MSSSKDLFEADLFAANMFASGLWRGVGKDATTQYGLEYTLPTNRPHYTLPDNRLHYTLPEED